METQPMTFEEFRAKWNGPENEVQRASLRDDAVADSILQPSRLAARGGWAEWPRTVEAAV